jgi:hypothetical protein
VRCVRFPPPGAALSAELRAAARWCNYYDRDDVMGFPLRPLSTSFSESVTEDVQLNSGNVFESWNPLSHHGYWNEKRFLRLVASQLANVQGALNGTG